jgi:hypothetical protein
MTQQRARFHDEFVINPMRSNSRPIKFETKTASEANQTLKYRNQRTGKTQSEQFNLAGDSNGHKRWIQNQFAQNPKVRKPLLPNGSR